MFSEDLQQYIWIIILGWETQWWNNPWWYWKYCRWNMLGNKKLHL